MSDRVEPLGGRGAKTVSRRGFLYGAAVGLGGLALSSCSPSVGLVGSGKSNNIVYWNLFTGGDGARMVTMENDFRKAHPGIKLDATALSWGAPYYTKVSVATAGGHPPDVAIMHLSKMGAYAPAGLLESFDPGELSQYGIGPDKFLPQVLDAAKYGGKIYAVPLDTHPFVQYYNKDICKKAGLLDSGGNLKPLGGPDGVIRAFEKAKKVTGDLGLAFYPANDPAGNWRLFLTLYSQMGGKILSPDAKKVVIDEAKAERALGFMVRLVKAGVMSPTMDYGTSVAAFQNGQVGFYWNGEWEVTTFQAAKMNFNMVPFPNIFGSKAAQADHHSFIVPKGVSPESKKRALEFISSMLKDSYVWAQGGHIPAYQPVVESQKYKKLKPQSNYASAAKYAVTDPVAWFSGAGSEMEQHASGTFQSVVSGQISPKQGIQQFRSYLQEQVKAPKPY